MEKIHYKKYLLFSFIKMSESKKSPKKDWFFISLNIFYMISYHLKKQTKISDPHNLTKISDPPHPNHFHLYREETWHSARYSLI